jgi:hypothetical protein
MILWDGTLLTKTKYEFGGKPTYTYHDQDIYGLVDEIVKVLEFDPTTPEIDSEFCYKILKSAEES